MPEKRKQRYIMAALVTALLVPSAALVGAFWRDHTLPASLALGGLIGITALMSAWQFRSLRLHEEKTERLREEAFSREKIAQTQAANDELRKEVEHRRQAQRELSVAIEKLRASNQELQEFAYICSHDLQEPLRKVQAFSDRLVSRLGDQIDDHSQDYLDRIVSAATRMRALIDGLLILSRVTSQGQPFKSINLDDICADVVADLEIKLAETSGTVQVGSLGEIEGDPIQLRQLMQNLIGNALKFVPADKAPRVNISACRTDQEVTLRVEDNGIGIEPKYQERIFEVFQRLNPRQAYDGTGMGLAICRKIVRRHGGEISVESALDEGATFIITLPLRTEPKPTDHDEG